MEVLVGVLVMMPLTLTAAMGLMVSVEASESAEHRQELEIALTSATENLKALPYLPCASPEDYAKAYRAWVQPLSAKVIESTQTALPLIESVAYWHRGKVAYIDSCPNDDGAQRLTVTIADDGRSVTGTVVKRNGTASVQDSGR